MDSTRPSPGGAHSLIAALPRRDLVLISTCIVIVTALAWAYLVHLDRQMSASMAHDRMMAEMGMSMDMPWTPADALVTFAMRSEEHTSELQSQSNLVCRLLLEKKKES